MDTTASEPLRTHYTSASMARPTKSSSPTALRSPSSKIIAKKPQDYSSEGVVDHDVFLLPGSDYQIMGVLTFLAAVIRLFRIYQPSSVVFDEVQYVSTTKSQVFQELTCCSLALVDLLRNILRGSSSWTFTLPSQNFFLRLLVG